MAQAQSEIRYLTPLSVDVKRKNTAVLKEVVLNMLITRILSFLKSSSTSKVKFFLVASLELHSNSNVA